MYQLPRISGGTARWVLDQDWLRNVSERRPVMRAERRIGARADCRSMDWLVAPIICSVPQGPSVGQRRLAPGSWGY